MDINEIKEQLTARKIKLAQIDPFSYCNSKCWFCPVKYTPNPKHAIKHMDIALFEKIIADIDSEKKKPDGLVSPNFDFIYTAHYNEVLLYKHFEEMVQVLKKYKIKTYILSNGLPLTPEKTDFIKLNLDTVLGICLNIPAFERETWTKRSGMPATSFDRLINNVKYAYEQLPDLVAKKALTIQINGATTNSFLDKGGWLVKGENFPQDMNLDPDSGELVKQHKLAEELFPKINITTNSGLIDRAGLLKDVISNNPAITKYRQKTSNKVVGCSHSHETGGRPFGWLHVNARGDAFLCCNDYNFDYTFDNLENKTIRDIWVTDKHAEIILKSYNEICKNCVSAIWEQNTEQATAQKPEIKTIMSKPKSTKKITLGTTVYDDYEGLFFTLQSIRMYHPGILNEIEFVVIDNNPDSKHGKLIKNFTTSIKQPIKYVPFKEYSSTGVKTKVFEHAETDYVLYFDSHVLFQSLALRKLIDFFDSGKDEGNLLQGPLIYDDLTNFATHFNLIWKTHMWGVWGTDERGRDPNNEPFEIDAQGTGVFACRKDSWLGFNPLFRGFGGEEGYIHKKYKNIGKKTLCLPFLRWLHRFGRPHGVPYPLTLEDKIRNYVIGHTEAGIDLAPMKAHFMETITEEKFEAIKTKALQEMKDHKMIA